MQRPVSSPSLPAFEDEGEDLEAKPEKAPAVRPYAATERYVELRREGRGTEAQAALTRTKEGDDHDKSSRTEDAICQKDVNVFCFLS
ncbi:hypothetical protein TRIUR3_20347 [Triticum urartu]|uniref:Uncharacterized protein n=2 Tax=Triticum TaxID=4564 RepID=A0A9R1P3L6_TRITD|nr:hypothetical protein TRIUR3_20347 [Triticum urartu]VAH36260.1 unnamed protein product [Triticum turgidum subsp. durum]